MFGTSLQPSLPLGRAFGVPIYADKSALFLLALVLMVNGTGGPTAMVASIFIAAVVVVSLVGHELGHALAVRWRGYGRSEIILGGLGGVCRWRGTPARGDVIRIALAGPAASLALAMIAYGVWRLAEPFIGGSVIAVTVFRAAVWLNGAWALFNLLPIFPMDGGRALRSAFMFRYSVRESVRRSLLVSMGLAAVVAVAGVIHGDIFLAVIVAMMLWSNWGEWQTVR